MALANALPELDVVGVRGVRLPRVHPGMLFGSGKVDDLKARFKAEDIALVLVDGPVSPVQQRNLEKEWGVKLLDRTGLILEIFADRARTREGVLQVELAALSYQRTRLVRAWTHLERQRGGFGFVGGPGETQIEADRRAIDDQVIRLKRQLDKVVKTRELHRAARARCRSRWWRWSATPTPAKVTLFNRMTGAEVLAKDMLFATLDPTMRGVVPSVRPQGHPVRYRGFHLGPADPACRRLPRHAGRGAGGRPDPACPRHQPSRNQRTGRRCGRYPAIAGCLPKGWFCRKPPPTPASPSLSAGPPVRKNATAISADGTVLSAASADNTSCARQTPFLHLL
jgi:hypothetical protein